MIFIYWSYNLQWFWTHLVTPIGVCMGAFLGFSVYKIMTFINRFFFPIQTTFMFSSCLNALPRTSSTMFSKNGERQHSCLTVCWRENIQPFTMKYDVGREFLVDDQVVNVPFYFRFVEYFDHDRMLGFSQMLFFFFFWHLVKWLCGFDHSFY